MAQKLAPRVAIYYLPELDTLDVWIDDPERGLGGASKR